VADDHLEGNYLNLANELLAHIETAHEVGRDANFAKPRHDILGYAVVQHPLAGDDAALLVIEGGRVVLEILDQRSRLRPLEENLGLAFIDLPAPGHRSPRG